MEKSCRCINERASRPLRCKRLRLRTRPFLDQMNQMGQALQYFSTDATLSEGQCLEQVRIVANLQAYTSNLHSAGAELERQHQLTMQRAEARVQQLLQDASLQYQAAEKRAIEAESDSKLAQRPRKAITAASGNSSRFSCPPRRAITAIA